MAKLRILGGSGEGRSLNVNASRSVNLYPELDADPTSKAVISLVKTPGCRLWGNVGVGPNRGQHVFNGRNYVVSGNGLFALDSVGTVSAQLGTLQTDRGQVSMRDNGLLSAGIGGNQLIIVDGTAGYIYDVIAGTFVTITSPGFPANPSHVEYIDGYFIVTNDTMNANASELYDGTTWNPLASTPVQSASDSIQVPVVFSEQLIFIKQYTTEYYSNNGTPTINGFPFSRVSGAVVPWGTDAPWSVCYGEGSIFWLATERKLNGGEFIGPVMLSGAVPTRIGTPAYNYRMSKWTDRANAFAYSYSEGGHTFVLFTSPGDNETFVYDTTTQMWHDRSSYTDNPYSINRHIGNSYVHFEGMHLIGDYQSGGIYRMSSDYLTEIGKPIVWLRRTDHLFDDDEVDRLFVNKLQIEADISTSPGTAAATTTLVIGGAVSDITLTDPGYDYTSDPEVVIVSVDGNGSGARATATAGGGSIQSITLTASGSGYTQPPQVVFVDPPVTPQIGLSYSTDNGRTYKNERVKDATGRIVFWKLGASRDKVWQLRGSGPVKAVLLGGYAEVEK